MSVRNSRHLCSLAAIAAALTCAGQSAAAPSPGEDDPITVTVTATRREASLQSVPVAVSVVSGAQLERDNRNNVSSLVQQVPSLNYRSGASNKDTSLFIRGVGTISTSPGVEPTVSTVIDGVVYGRPGQSTLDLLDVSRIEVLRGPQGTLFGKNASAGVLNIISRDAPETTQGYVDYSHFSEGNENRLRVGVGGRLSDTLKGSLNAVWATYDGNVDNVHNGETVNGYDRKGVRGKLVFEPNPDFRFTLIGDYSDGEDDIPGGVITSVSNATFAAALLPVVASADNRRINNDYRTFVEDSNGGLSGQADLRIGGFTLTSITAWRKWENTQYQDGDRLAALPVSASHDKGEVDFSQVSQEFRLASPKGQFSEYVIGVYYFHGRSKETYQRWSTSAGVLNHGRADYSVTNDSFALFGENTFNFTPRLRGILGLRWTYDELEYDHARVSTSATAVTGIQPSTSSFGSTTEDGFSGRAGLQYDFSDALTSYLTWSRGYKGPAYNVFFNMQARDTLALEPETSDSWELGFKSATFDNRLIANLALFHAEYDNYQANFYDEVAGQVVTRLINAGTVKTEGAELDWRFRATPNLSLSGALAYTKARIKNFNCPPAAASSCNVNGTPISLFTPEWKHYVRLDYSLPLQNGLRVDFGTDYNWSDEVSSGVLALDSYGLWNASVALVDEARGWRAALLAKNITDESYSTFLADGGSHIYRIVPRDDQRYFGVQLRKDF